MASQDQPVYREPLEPLVISDQRGLRELQEIKVLMLHGLLHLLGMDHETDRGRMARAANRPNSRARSSRNQAGWRARITLIE